MTATETTFAEAALNAIGAHTGADNPSAFLAVNDGNSYFTLPGIDGVIVYRTSGRYLVQFAGPFASPDSYLALLDAFRKFATAQERTVVGIQLQRPDAERYVEQGFTVNQVGASWAMDLNRFSLVGTKFMRLRNKIARAGKAGLTVHEVQLGDWESDMRALDRQWLRGKSEGAHELEYLVGQYGGPMQRHRRLFVGLINGILVGYISYSPVYGSRAGWMHDLSRRIPGKLPGIMESINKKAIEHFLTEGVNWLHYGFTPFTGLDEAAELPGHSRGFRLLMAALWEHGAEVYPAQTQLAYKQKWEQHLVLPEYVAFDGPADVSAFAHVFRAAGAF